MKTLNALINADVPNEQLPLNLEKASKILEMFVKRIFFKITDISFFFSKK